MKIVRSEELAFIPASHEDPKSPGVLKRVLLKKEDLMEGRIIMVNWALLPAEKSFRPHYHEDMEEVFVIVRGNVKIVVDKEERIMGPGDAVVIPVRSIHVMENIGKEDCHYIAIGVSREGHGRTVVV